MNSKAKICFTIVVLMTVPWSLSAQQGKDLARGGGHVLTFADGGHPPPPPAPPPATQLSSTEVLQADGGHPPPPGPWFLGSSQAS
jgi:hypothetical protein